jgi:integrase
MKFDKTTDLKAIPTMPSAGKADEIIFDETLPGFGLRLRSSGARTWVCQYRSRGRSRRAVLGPFVKLKPAQARQAAEKFFAEVLLGGDPQAKKEKERREEERSMLSVAKQFIDARQGDLRPATTRENRRYLLDPHYFGKLHRAGVSTITRADVAPAITRIANINGKVAAARARTALSSMFAWAIGEAIIVDGSNPVVGSNKPKPPPARDHTLSDAEITAVWKACEGEDQFGAVVKLLLVTGCRRSEIGGLRHSEINLVNETITIPVLRSKNQKPTVIPLSSLAREIYEALPREPGSDLVFKGCKGFQSWDRTKRELDAKLGDVVRPYRLHDLRRSFATGLGNLKTRPHVIECLLGHRGGFKSGVSGIYNWSEYMPEMREAAEMWAAHLRELVEGTPSKIVKLPRKKALALAE